MPISAQLYLEVPFAEKDQAKKLGARWDPALKKWYAPHGVDLHVLRAWWPASLAGEYERMADAPPAAAPAPRPKKRPAKTKPSPVVIDDRPLKNDRSTPDLELPWD